MNNLHDLFIHEIQDLYSAEKQIVEALPKMIKAVNNENLKKGFEIHLEQTEKQIERLEKIFDELDISSNVKKCKGMEGILEEGNKVLEEKVEPEVLDAALISAAQKVEHYEIAGYGAAAVHAEEMKHMKAANLLKETLAEEKMADEKLSQIAESEVNEKANDM